VACASTKRATKLLAKSARDDSRLFVFCKTAPNCGLFSYTSHGRRSSRQPTGKKSSVGVEFLQHALVISDKVIVMASQALMICIRKTGTLNNHHKFDETAALSCGLWSLYLNFNIMVMQHCSPWFLCSQTLWCGWQPKCSTNLCVFAAC